ncbi:rod shape-determining protein RodA [Chitinispirillales bacterium ANBcel5]|uniref:rod shape-determining protein RodA n=1 Tax=Cellulosispirillum alkaliphilum TaxID=3039283 RepID=UPI002A55B9F1|nr:rod shape-determining protein RodA [Chitinispirillales bacterium ANBcel5]
MDELRKKGGFDFSLFGAAVLLWVIGIFIIYSATSIHESGRLVGIYKNQIIWVSMAILIVLAIVSIPGRYILTFSYPTYIFSLVLLVMVLMVSSEVKGAGRWISLGGGFNFQPSEFAKVGLLLALSKYLSENTVSLYKISTFIIPGILISVPFVLVMAQPDLGTAMVFCAMALPLFYWAGLSLLQVFFLVSPVISLVLSAFPLLLSYDSGQGWGFVEALPWGIFFLAIVTVLYLSRPPLFIWIGVIVANIVTSTLITVVWSSVLKDYQKLRIVTLINPQADPGGAAYQVIQSRVAIGSGHIFGKGYLQGTQTRLSFLPEQHTDFIFSVLGEQFGFVGCAVIILLFLFLIIRGLMVTQSVRNRFINLLAVGSASILAFHVFVNVAMTLGIMPVTGLPLPFLSYGGSFTITVAVLVGLFLNCKITRQDF